MPIVTAKKIGHDQYSEGGGLPGSLEGIVRRDLAF
jgi:hypothetical protein